MAGPKPCEIFIDGASKGNPGHAGLGVVFRDPSGGVTHTFGHYIGKATNNAAEYLALIYALQEAQQRGFSVVSINTDSELLTRQITGRYQVRHPELKKFYDQVVHLLNGFSSWAIRHVPREQNKEVDRLATEAVKAHLKKQASLSDK